MTRLILVRHGEPREARATADDGLTEHGRRQAVALGPPLRSLAPDVVIVSPTHRAIETAELAGIPFRLDAAFETFRYGAGEVRERGDGPELWRPDDRYAVDGESLGEFHERVATGLANLLAGSPQSAVVIAHGGIINVVLRIAWGLDSAAPWLADATAPLASITEVIFRRYANGTPANQLVRFGDVSHLVGI